LSPHSIMSNHASDWGKLSKSSSLMLGFETTTRKPAELIILATPSRKSVLAPTTTVGTVRRMTHHPRELTYNFTFLY
jgi:hypothetical protein